MAGTVGAGPSRVTIVAPRTRVDLAIPSDVPLAHLLPTLLRYAGEELADSPEGSQGWALARLGGVVLDSSRTPGQLEVRDGDLLYLRPRGADHPELVFDDVVDAVATATQERAGRWRPATTRRFGLTLGVAALLAGAVVVLLAGPPQLGSALVGLGGAVVLLVAAAVLARALGDSRAAVGPALAALSYAGIGGLLLFAGDRRLDELSAPHVLTAASALLVVTTLVAVGVADAAPLFLAAAIGSVALGVGAVICMLTGAGTAGAAAVVGGAALATLPALPMLAYRMGRLPIPSVPADPEELKADTESVDGVRVLAASERADAFLAGMLGALAAIVGLAAVLVATDGFQGVAMAAVFGLVLLARARWFIGRQQRLPLLVAGAVGIGSALGGTFGATETAVRLTVVLGGLLVIAAISVSYALAGAGRRASPVWGRTLDIVEVTLILAVVPLAAWVSGLYDWIRTVRG
jgi:type VII secretion integral membrane protein EccD